MGKAKAKAKKKTTGARAKRDRRRKLATEAPASAEELLASVPGLDALQDVPAFDDLPVDEAQQTAFDDFCAHAEEPEQMQLGAVVRLDRGFPLVATADDTFRAEHAVGFAKSRGEDEVLLPAVGDRVAVRRAPGHDMGVIECVLPRHTSFERWRGRARGERQVLCSNVDSVLIVQALGAGEVLLDRVARSLVLALDCDAEPVVVLTKADRCDAEELERDLDRARRLVGPDVRVIVTSSAEGRGLDEVRSCVPAGSCAMILGESGAGKSTLLNCVSTIDSATSGTIRINGQDVTRMKQAKLSQFRREELGFIFQDSNLLDTLTARENIALPLTIARMNSAEISTRVQDVAARLSISQVLDKYPYQMSGGQQQRVAACRALVTDPTMIMADEPTGALDSKSARLLLESLEALNRRLRATVLMVTHDSFAASYTSRVLFIRDGKIFTELRRGDTDRREFFDRIMEVVAMMGGEGSDAL